MPQGLGADLIATLEGFSREEVDRFALESHQKAARAQSLGYFKGSVVGVNDQNCLPILTEDEMIRRETTFEGLAQLKPAFAKLAELGYLGVALRKYPSIERINHVHTAGNSSGISDGASAVLLANEQTVKRHDFKPKGRIVAMAAAGTEPTIMLTGPTPATQKALARAKLRVSDIDLFEVNEAFAAVVLKFAKDLNIPHEKINANGGAIALGHPLGATGGILVSMLLDELHRQKKRYGVVTLCIGAGMGLATVIERI
jgi:acetyl-CoA C-acetyltransferase